MVTTGGSYVFTSLLQTVGIPGMVMIHDETCAAREMRESKVSGIELHRLGGQDCGTGEESRSVVANASKETKDPRRRAKQTAADFFGSKTSHSTSVPGLRKEKKRGPESRMRCGSQAKAMLSCPVKKPGFGRRREKPRAELQDEANEL
ncbi:hypothetical protein LZ31DRAFT_186362 [Colletotrichum somersetense]|nr:hypothetical protein LZ31DRAFT_186362 [Colletotrichum somersetense]